MKVIAGDYTRLRSVRVTLPKGVKVSRGRRAGRTAGKPRGRSLSVSRGRILRAKPPRRGAKRLSLRAGRVKVARRLVGRRVRVRIAAKEHRSHGALHRQDARAALGSFRAFLTIPFHGSPSPSIRSPIVFTVQRSGLSFESSSSSQCSGTATGARGFARTP